MSQPSKALVASFWLYMTKQFGTKVVHKPSAWEMRIAAWVLKRRGVMDPRQFLARYVTTIGKRIYVPFEVGTSQGGWDLWHQMIVCVHEHQHVVQYQREGRWRFFTKYLLRKPSRGLYEADALTGNLEMHHWRYGRLPDAEALAAGLHHYDIEPEDVAMAQRVIWLSGVTVSRGGTVTKAFAVAKKWLNRQAKHLRRVGQA